MTTVERLDQWRREGIINDAQHDTLAGLVRKERFSLFLELNALLYVGVLSLAAGLGWTIQTHFARLGDAFILGILSLTLAGSLAYCFAKAPVYSSGEVESPNFILDYVVYLACLVLAIEFGYLEFRFEWLKEAWGSYLLFSSVVFFVLAYRFDNRFVLSLALSTLAGWIGLKLSPFGFVPSGRLRIFALVYGAVVAAAGLLLHGQNIKKHFLGTYLHFAANLIFIALVSGLDTAPARIYLLALLSIAVTAIALGVRFKRFAFVLYGTVYGYIGVSIELLRRSDDFTTVLSYVVASGTIVIAVMAMLARRFGREE